MRVKSVIKLIGFQKTKETSKKIFHLKLLDDVTALPDEAEEDGVEAGEDGVAQRGEAPLGRFG